MPVCPRGRGWQEWRPSREKKSVLPGGEPKYQQLKRRRMTAGLLHRQLRIVQEHPGLSPQKPEPLQDPLSAAKVNVGVDVNVFRPIRALGYRAVVDKR